MVDVWNLEKKMFEKHILNGQFYRTDMTRNRHTIWMFTGLRKCLKFSVFEYLPVIRYVHRIIIFQNMQMVKFFRLINLIISQSALKYTISLYTQAISFYDVDVHYTCKPELSPLAPGSCKGFKKRIIVSILGAEISEIWDSTYVLRKLESCGNYSILEH